MGILDKISKKGGEAAKKDEKKPKADDVKQKAAAAKSPAKDEGKKDVKKPVKQAAKKTDEPKAEEKKDKGAEKKESKPEASFAYRVISHPIATEKSDRQQMFGKYTFTVARGANKVEIARAVKALYGVDPVSVRVMNVKGKKVRFGRLYGRRKDTRKAIVTLKEGDSISLAE